MKSPSALLSTFSSLVTQTTPRLALYNPESFDWANFDAQQVVSANVDSTCTVWDVERQAVDTQLVVHDKEASDISWGGFNVFASVSGDGSIRVFDLSDKERSIIFFENPIQKYPLLRLEWNTVGPRAVRMDSNKVVIVDIQFPTTPLMELCRHKGSVNATSWTPYNGRLLCSVGDDSWALIWEVVAAGDRSKNGDNLESDMWYGSSAEINNV
ncbi:hypothetical protein SLA2020_040250 [Shorea laevis]